MQDTLKISFILVLFALCAGSILALPPIAQDPNYHQFADSRLVLTIHNFWNVISNVPFVIVGIWGLLDIYPAQKNQFINSKERIFFAFMFCSFALVGIGSSIYHLDPKNETLVWDRLPMTLAFMSFFAIVIAERIHLKAGFYLFPVFILLGIASVGYWHLSEQAQQGDLRFYALVQFFPMLAIPLLVLLFKPKYTGSYHFLIALGWYVLAKLCESYDLSIYAYTYSNVSGHTLKHLAAAAACYELVRYVGTRKLVN